jgi:hypothetical protein
VRTIGGETERGLSSFRLPGHDRSIVAALGSILTNDRTPSGASAAVVVTIAARPFQMEFERTGIVLLTADGDAIVGALYSRAPKPREKR